MKKRRSFLFALMFLLACLFATAALASETTTTNTNVNLRSGPGTQYERLSVIPSGTNVTVEEKDSGSGWTKISYGGKTGYVVTRYLGVGSVSTTGGNYTTTARVHLRSGPGTSNAVLLTVPKGATVAVSSSSNGWAAANYNGKSGYISTQYLQAAGGSAANPNTTVTGNTGAAGSASATTTANVNLRSGAGTSYSVVVIVPKGASVTVNSTANGWANVSYNGKTGYMSAQYLSGLAGGSGSASSTQTTTARVNMRSGPATSNSVVLIIPKGASVTVTSTSNGWSAVSYNGKNGYVSSQYLSGSGTGSGSSTGSTGTSGSASATATANVNMRSGAGTSYAVVVIVPKGAAVTVNSTANGWASVSYGGKSGYISTQYLSGLGGSGGSSSSTKKTTANVHLRSGAGTSSSIILTIPKGTSVTVTSTSNGWSAVSYSGHNGYVSSQYLK